MPEEGIVRLMFVGSATTMETPACIAPSNSKSSRVEETLSPSDLESTVTVRDAFVRLNTPEVALKPGKVMIN